MKTFDFQDANRARFGARPGTKQCDALAERLLRTSVTEQAERLHLPTQRSTRPIFSSGRAHARGRFVQLQILGTWWSVDTGYVTPYGNVRMYWRADDHRRLQVTVQLLELDEMSQWSLRFLAQETDWASPPRPVTEELAQFGMVCRYLWTLDALTAYEACRVGWAH